MRNVLGRNGNGSQQQVRRRGLAVLLVATSLGIVAAFALVLWSAEPKALALPDSASQGVPRGSAGLAATSDNKGQVLFGRFCDSCHPGGDEGRGVSLLSSEFRRDFKNEAEVAQLVRDGTCKMPAYTRFLVPDADVSEISKFVLSRAQTAASRDPSPPLAPLDGPGILEKKCNNCHVSIEPHLDPRDVQILFALNDMAKCAGLTADQRSVLRTYLLSQQPQPR